MSTQILTNLAVMIAIAGGFVIAFMPLLPAHFLIVAGEVLLLLGLIVAIGGGVADLALRSAAPLIGGGLLYVGLRRDFVSVRDGARTEPTPNRTPVTTRALVGAGPAFGAGAAGMCASIAVGLLLDNPSVPVFAAWLVACMIATVLLTLLERWTILRALSVSHARE
ncbi:hypothetical protein GOEFS_119_00270 [Gordonia effusa NBRC 100432]|uniref:Uncharacterized protein n=1 Tax=Gordonia effusa NBRC 100432 TaxID=1077974 RepID=H0R636_9ACTN|nr:hypothetical protein [Gordonia effusa]GAB20537.1 hypothetical protein GOEFS_119_00270 [Gordonia effusa NBRC 100432]